MAGFDHKSINDFDQDRPFEVVFFLTPEFALLAYASASETLRGANRVLGREAYRWSLISGDGQPVRSGNGVELPTHNAFDYQHPIDMLVLVGGMDTHTFEDEKVFAWIRRTARNGKVVGAISTGSYLMAKSGILDGYNCTIHWENLSSFRESYPQLEILEDIYVIDRDRFTCSGGTASIDLMLQLIAAQHGTTNATTVASHYMHERVRRDNDRQLMDPRHRLGVVHPRLRDAVLLMEDRIENPLSCAKLAETASMSSRQLERLFRKYFNTSPTRYYLNMRLDQSRRLLRQTSMPVLDVALACGFESASHFSKCYKERFSLPPSQDR